MLDAHVHIERGPYTGEWIGEFVRYAGARGITELRLLEHSHRFLEFRRLYDGVCSHPVTGEYQRQWIEKRCVKRLDDYKDFVTLMRKAGQPMTVRFGLEVCFFPGREDETARLLEGFDWDFIAGSVHWIDGWGFDHAATKASWEGRDVDATYRQYYRQMAGLVASGLFDTVAHPDSIKCFGHKPAVNMDGTYRELAMAMKMNDVSAEFSCGLAINYGHQELGMDGGLLRCLMENEVEVVTASDAHRPEDAGRFIRESEEILARYNHYRK